MDFSSGTKDTLKDLSNEFVDEIGLASKSLFQHAGLRDINREFVRQDKTIESTANMLEGLSALMAELEAQKIRVNQSFGELNNISALMKEINDMFELNEIQKPSIIVPQSNPNNNNTPDTFSIPSDSSPNLVNVNSNELI